MRFHRFILSLFLIGLSRAVPADTLYLENGDRISGKLAGTAAGVLTIVTEYAGEVKVQQASIIRIETETPVTVTMKGGLTLVGMFEEDQGKPVVRTGDARYAVDFAEIASITAAPAPGPAQEAASKPKRWSGAVDAGASLRTGNTDTADANLAAEVVREGNWNTLTLKASGAYGEADGVLNTRRYLGEAQWQVYPLERLYFYGLVGGEHDAGRKLELRAHTAAGVGWDFLKNDRRKLSADIGPDYTWERWMPFTPQERDDVKNQRRAEAFSRLNQLVAGLGAGVTGLSFDTLSSFYDTVLDIHDPLRDEKPREEDFVNLRTSGYFEQKLFRQSSIGERLTILANLSEPGEFRLVSELAFTTPLLQALKLRVSLKSEYDSLARKSGVEAWDNWLLTSLRYEF